MDELEKDGLYSAEKYSDISSETAKSQTPTITGSDREGGDITPALTLRACGMQYRHSSDGHLRIYFQKKPLDFSV